MLERKTQTTIRVAAELILEQIKKKRYSTKAWKEHALNPKECTKETIEWIFLVDLLNFSFWNERSELLEYSVNGYKGYWSLCAAINRAIYDEGIPVTSPYWMKECSWEMIQHVFRPDAGCCQAPLLKERFQVIRKAASILVEVSFTLKIPISSLGSRRILCQYYQKRQSFCLEACRIDCSSIWRLV